MLFVFFFLDLLFLEIINEKLLKMLYEFSTFISNKNRYFENKKEYRI